MNLQIGVKILLINENNEVLLMRRSQKVEHGNENVWDIPGGRMEPNEPLMDALVREVKEETGMTLLEGPKLLAAQDIFVTKKALHVIRLTYRGVATGDITLSVEHDAFRWMDKLTLFDSDINLDPYLKEIL